MAKEITKVFYELPEGKNRAQVLDRVYLRGRAYDFVFGGFGDQPPGKRYQKTRRENLLVTFEKANYITFSVGGPRCGGYETSFFRFKKNEFEPHEKLVSTRSLNKWLKENSGKKKKK